MRNLLGVIFFLNLIYSTSIAQRFILSGYVNENKTNEILMGVNVVIPTFNKVFTTNVNGFYSFSLPENDSIEVIFSYVGYSSQKHKISLQKDTKMDILLSPIMLNEVEIIDKEKLMESRKVETGLMNLPIKEIKSMPVLLGEKDILKAIQLMPGVQKGSEASAGLYVRGGGPDQNLVKVDDAVIYNPFHVFGFLSLFNVASVKSVEVLKGGFPAKYGGRLSSVIELRLKEGNKEKVSGEFGLGLLTGKVFLEGPFQKGKSSWMLSARRSYMDAFINPFLPENQRASFYFYDLNAKVSFDLGNRDKIFVSAYNGRDNFSYKSKIDWNYRSKPRFFLSEATVNWGNTFVSAGWSHEFSPKLISNLSAVYTSYQFDVNANNGNDSLITNSKYQSAIKDFSLAYDLEYFVSNSHKLKLGIQTINHLFNPEQISVSVNSIRFSLPSNGINMQESGIYVEDQWRISTRLRANYGLRISHAFVQNTHYIRPEPRLALSYMLKEDISIKAGFVIMNQYMHLLQNSGTNLPTDIWIPVTDKILPQTAYLGTIGVVKDFKEKKFFISVEAYYKYMRNIQGYKENSTLVPNYNTNSVTFSQSLTNLEVTRRVATGNAWSYGCEFLVQKKEGKFTGWVGYTLSWTQFQLPNVNFGEPFYAKYDRRHDLSVVANYALTPKITLSATWVYATGNRLTLPVSDAAGFGVIYSNKNEILVKPFHRLDLGIQFHKILKKNRSRTWEISVYNAYNRANTYLLFVSENETTRNVLKEVTGLPILPSVNYTYRF